MTYIFLKFALIMFVSAFSASFLRLEFSLVLAVCAFFGGICFFFFGKSFREISALFAAAFLGFGLVSLNLITEFYPAKALDKMSAGITGTVVEISAAGGNPVYTVETESISIEGAPQKITLLLSGWDENSASPFDKISCKVSFSVYSEENVSEFLTNRSGGISVYAYTNSPIEVIGKENNSFRYFIYMIRNKISSVIYEYYLDWHAPFMEQILIGTRGNLESEITDSFRKSGMSHILAISGMHLVVISDLFEKLLRLTKIGKKQREAVLFIIIILYMFIGGLGMSILRSGFMLAAHYLARIFFSGSKSLDNLGIAISAVILADPSSACDVGFIMSALSCLSIAVFASPSKRYLSKLLHGEEKPAVNFFIEAFCVSSVAFVAVLPVSSAVFGNFSLASPLSNLFSGFFTQYTIIFGIVTVILGFVPFLGFFAGGTAFIGMIFSGLILKTAEFFSSIEFLYVESSENWFLIWLFGAAWLFIFPMVYSKSFRYIRHSALMSAFALLAGILLDLIMFSGVSEIRITALEHGTAISCSKDGESVLITKGLCAYDRFKINSKSSDPDVFISLDAENSSAEFEILEASDPELALLSTDEFTGMNSSVQKVSSGKITAFKDCFVEIIRNSAVAIETNGTTLLYIFKECDIMEIEPKFRRADIIILEGVSPEAFPVLRSDFLILRNFGGFYSGTSEIIVLKTGEEFFFAQNGKLLKGGRAG